MNRALSCRAARCATLLIGLVAASVVRAEPESPPAPVGAPLPASQPAVAEQVLVLRDGGVLVGRVEQAGDRYRLTRGSIELLVPASNVELVAASLDDAYQQRRGRMTNPTADAHLTLADWCLRHELTGPAAHELAAARALNAAHPQLEFVERRLALAEQRQATKAAPAALAPGGSAPVAAPTESVEPMAINELPPGAVELFTRKVQPVLVNTCTTSGCHQAGGGQTFQLDRAVLRGMSNRRTTMQNLSAALTLINRDEPRESPLLTIPRLTHGGLDKPVFGPRQEAAFRHLSDWVALVTHEPAKAAAPLTDASAESAANSDGSEVQNAGATAADDGGSVYQAAATLPDLRSAEQGTAITPIVGQGVQLKRWAPRDEFDPEIFNRRFSAASNNAQPAAQAKQLSAEDSAQADADGEDR